MALGDSNILRPSTIVGDSLQGITPTIMGNRFDFEVTFEGLYVALGSSRATTRKFIPLPPFSGIPLIHDFPTKKKQVMESKKRFLKIDPISWTTNRASSEEISKLLCTTAIKARAYKVYHPGKRTAFQTPATAMCVYLDQIMCRLRFPLHPFIIQVCDEFCVGLPQLTPHLITVLIAFIVKCQLLNVPLSIEAFTFLFQLKPLERTSAWYYICRRHLEFEGFEGSRIKYDNSVLPTSLPTLGKTDWQERFFFLEGPKNSNFPAIWRNGRTNTPKILLDAESYLIINKLLNNNSIKAEVLLDEGNLVRSKVWHHHHVPSTVIILNLPLDFEATKKPETSFQKSEKRKESSVKENLKKLFTNSHENYLSIKKEKDKIEIEMKANHSALEEARTKLSSQNVSLQTQIANTSTDTIHKFKRSEEGQTWALSGCIDHFHLAVSIITTLILERDMLKGDHIPSIQELNISKEIKQDPGLKKMFEDGVKKISKECYFENEGGESADQECDSSNPEHEDSSQDEASSS
ncbi:hypothetical protein SLEP1_g11807 [Rubroshorea leprosula]|nr:hypothetical protein SLEP1_g11807 [Rubroshorea leprosula]